MNNTVNMEYSIPQLATDDEITSSQEMPIISEENFRTFFWNELSQNNDLSELICSLPGVVPPVVGSPTNVSEENVANNSVSYETYPPSCSSDTLNYGFDIHFEGKNRKGAHDIYSQEFDRLYVTKDIPCSINFITSVPVPQGVKIRASASFCQLEFANDVVSRCQNHMMSDKAQGIPFPEHFIRCESKNAVYEIHPETGRQSVIVPYEMPQCGQNYSTYIYKFVCFGSCAGLNRKPMKLTFDLEWQSVIIAHRSLNIKVCATPPRDYKIDCKPKKNNNVNVVDVKQEVSIKKEFEPLSCVEITQKGDQLMLQQWNESFVRLDTLAPDTNATGVTKVSSCPPAANNWSGSYGFKMQINVSDSAKAKTCYSERLDKLYIVKDVPCAFTFTTDNMVPPNSKIRVMAVFSQSEHVNEVVRRCFYHCNKDTDKGISCADHLIQCESNVATYDKNEVTSRYSVVVPYNIPHNSSSGASYAFKFCCYSSCPGGLNRRPMKAIFTLENENQILGRRSLDVKICASTRRDFKSEEKKFVPGVRKSPPVIPAGAGPPPAHETINPGSLCSNISLINTLSLSADTPQEDNNQEHITVYGKELYAFLLKVQFLYRQEKAKQQKSAASESNKKMDTSDSD